MELPVAPQSYRPTTETLIRAILRADLVLFRMMAEEATLDGAVALTNAKRPAVRMCNLAAEMHVPEGVSGKDVVAGVLEHFRQKSLTCLSMRAAEASWPERLAKAAQDAGYSPMRMNLFVLDRFRRPAQTNQDLQVIPGRAAYDEVRRLHYREVLQHDPTTPAVAEAYADAYIDQLDEPRLECFLGRIDRQPVGIVNVVGLGNIGVIDYVMTDHDHRGNGVASTLLTHAIEFCHRALFEQVVLETTLGCPAERLYESIGFRRVTEFVKSYRVGGTAADAF